MAQAKRAGLIKWLAAVPLALLAAFAGGFPLAGFIGSAIPENAEWSEPAAGVTIMIETNGVHTGIVVPVTNAVKDWRVTFPSASQPRPDGSLPTHLGIGWGEREVFLDVAEWSDLKPGTALRVATTGGTAIMRVSPYVWPAPSENYRPLRITLEQYRRLIIAIERSLKPAPPGQQLTTLRGYSPVDAYYEATGTYTLFDTCNTWVGDALAEAGVKMGAWTPFAGGVMKWIPLPPARP